MYFFYNSVGTKYLSRSLIGSSLDFSRNSDRTLSWIALWRRLHCTNDWIIALGSSDIHTWKCLPISLHCVAFSPVSSSLTCLGKSMRRERKLYEVKADQILRHN